MDKHYRDLLIRALKGTLDNAAAYVGFLVGDPPTWTDSCRTCEPPAWKSTRRRHPRR